MIIDYKKLAANKIWTNAQVYKQGKEFEPVYNLVTSKGSLTKLLMEIGGSTFKVNVLEEKVTLPYFHERQKRTIQNWAMIREVELEIHNQAVIYARSIIPLNLITKGQSGLSKLGSKPLGHLLFKDGQTNTSERQFSKFTVNKKRIDARRTPYSYMDSTILVSEFFLPALTKHLK